MNSLANSNHCQDFCFPSMVQIYMASLVDSVRSHGFNVCHPWWWCTFQVYSILTLGWLPVRLATLSPCLRALVGFTLTLALEGTALGLWFWVQYGSHSTGCDPTSPKVADPSAGVITVGLLYWMVMQIFFIGTWPQRNSRIKGAIFYLPLDEFFAASKLEIDGDSL